jgi:S-adenosylmethionine decarboxylase
MTYWGYHLLLDCSGCDLNQITNKNNIRSFVKDLVESIDMVAINDTWIERTAIGDITKEGFSMYQLLVTSNISAHFIDEPRHIYLDVFSCKSFNVDTVKDCVNKYFTPKKIRTNFLTRNAD